MKNLNSTDVNENDDDDVEDQGCIQCAIPEMLSARAVRQHVIQTTFGRP